MKPDDSATFDLTHFDDSGAARMVDVSAKSVTARQAVAEGYVVMQSQTLSRIVNRELAKGDVLEVARLAGLMGLKRTSELIPLCHPLPVESARIELVPHDATTIRIEATVSVSGKTGVEMEALTAVTVAALTIYDMCKAIDRGIEIQGVRVLEKSGGKSGHFRAQASKKPV